MELGKHPKSRIMLVQKLALDWVKCTVVGGFLAAILGFIGKGFAGIGPGVVGGSVSGGLVSLINIAINAFFADYLNVLIGWPIMGAVAFGGGLAIFVLVNAHYESVAPVLIIGAFLGALSGAMCGCSYATYKLITTGNRGKGGTNWVVVVIVLSLTIWGCVVLLRNSE